MFHVGTTVFHIDKEAMVRSFKLVALLLGSVALAQGTPAKAPAAKAPAKAPAAAATDAGAAPAPAAGGKAKLDGAKLFQDRTCWACHGKDAKTPILPNYPRLAGQNAAYAEQQIRDIKSGARSNGQTAAMKGVMVIVSDDEIPALALYISTLKP